DLVAETRGGTGDVKQETRNSKRQSEPAPVSWTPQKRQDGSRGRRPMVRKKNRYSEGFRAEAVRRIVEEGLQVSELAKSLGMDESLLYRWVRRAAARKVGSAAVAVQARETLDEEVKRLRRENAQLRMEKAILKKAAAFFAKES